MVTGLTALEGEKFAVGLSFAGEQRDYVQDVALGLQARGVRVFYDAFEEDALWGCDLIDTLHDLYSERMQRVVVFVSKEYVAKPFTNLERRSALSKAITLNTKYVLPVRFDDTVLPGMPSSTGYLRASDKTPEQLAVAICNQLGMSQSLKANQIPPPRSEFVRETISFCHVDHDGRHIIGKDEWAFEIKVAGAHYNSIQFYNDPPGIRGVAHADHVSCIDELGDASSLNFSSRVRTVYEGQLVVLVNTNGFYAAIKVVDVKAKYGGDTEDVVTLEYLILKDGGSVFSKTASTEIAKA